MRSTVYIVALVSLVLGLGAPPLRAGGRPAAEDTLAVSLFGKGAAAHEQTRRLTSMERGALKSLGVKVPLRGLAWYRVVGESGVVGHMARWQGRGRHGMIDVLVASDAEFSVAGLSVIKHRERRGAGITRKRFLKQFVGKERGDAWRIGTDIDGITSATVSTRAVAVAVRNALHFLATVAGGDGES